MRDKTKALGWVLQLPHEADARLRVSQFPIGGRRHLRVALWISPSGEEPAASTHAARPRAPASIESY